MIQNTGRNLFTFCGKLYMIVTGSSVFRRTKYKGGETYIDYLRKQGIKIGEDCVFRSAKTTRIDLTRPSLIEIGDNVDMNMNFQIYRLIYQLGKNYFILTLIS